MSYLSDLIEKALPKKSPEDVQRELNATGKPRPSGKTVPVMSASGKIRHENPSAAAARVAKQKPEVAQAGPNITPDGQPIYNIDTMRMAQNLGIPHSYLKRFVSSVALNPYGRTDFIEKFKAVAYRWLIKHFSLPGGGLDEDSVDIYLNDLYDRVTRDET